MTISYARSTYLDIIDDVIFDLNEPADKISRIPKIEWKRWLLDGCKEICDHVTVYDQKQLRLIKGVEDYQFADTKNSLGTGTITATGVNVVGVGTKFLTEIVGGSVITSATESHKVVSITDDLNLIIDQPFALSVSGLSFTYSPKASEIPNDTKTVYYIDRSENGLRRQVLMKDMNDLLSLRRDDVVTARYTNLDIPYAAAFHTSAGIRYLRFYPASIDADKTVILYLILQVNPRVHWADDLQSVIPMGENYEHAIKHFMAMKFYSYWHDVENEKKYIALYRDSLQQIDYAEPNLVTLDFQYR